ncbi:MAG: hypothetical protein COU25_01330 [Candidatus Levybacteria bacterium CG10_big_fil_rev_8_21_14_0_10_35_13]|nr:MAG: hypothetical protein COU25_01330 [Candidatus Levybacteria bacterium CG10_big_fil_rev_8_21_14_0_10_35_13]
MKTKHFYTHLIETTDITLEIAQLNVTSKERVHLLSLVEANIHSAVVSMVLSSLEPHDKKIFLQNLSINEHNKTWLHLRQKAGNIEEEIKKTIDDTISELLKDVRKVKS